MQYIVPLHASPKPREFRAATAISTTIHALIARMVSA